MGEIRDKLRGGREGVITLIVWMGVKEGKRDTRRERDEKEGWIDRQVRYKVTHLQN